MPALAALARSAEADTALADAARVLEADPAGSAPGRSGFDPAEYELLAAEAHLVLGRPRQAAALSETSAATCPTGTPGWAAAALVLAQAEATFHCGQAEQHALDALDRVPAARLRSTARTCLRRLDTALAQAGTALRERLRVLPLPIDHHGATTA